MLNGEFDENAPKHEKNSRNRKGRKMVKSKSPPTERKSVPRKNDKNQESTQHEKR